LGGEESVFPFNKFIGQDILLSPEMRSPAKSWASTPTLAWPTRNPRWPRTRRCHERKSFHQRQRCAQRRSRGGCKSFADLGFELVATSGTAAVLEKAGMKVVRVLKLLEGRPNIVDLIKNKEIQLVINTPAGQSPRADEVKIRTTAVYTGTPIMTTLSSAKAAALASPR